MPARRRRPARRRAATRGGRGRCGAAAAGGPARATAPAAGWRARRQRGPAWRSPARATAAARSSARTRSPARPPPARRARAPRSCPAAAAASPARGARSPTSTAPAAAGRGRPRRARRPPSGPSRCRPRRRALPYRAPAAGRRAGPDWCAGRRSCGPGCSPPPAAGRRASGGGRRGRSGRPPHPRGSNGRPSVRSYCAGVTGVAVPVEQAGSGGRRPRGGIGRMIGGGHVAGWVPPLGLEAGRAEGPMAVEHEGAGMRESVAGRPGPRAPSETQRRDLVARARAVLDANWRGRWTVPSRSLYPHQWSWDAAFIAIGRSWVEQDRAQRELESIFEAQWSTGMLPHIRFDPEVPDDAYFPSPGFWQSDRSPAAPRGVPTSGITQPPLHARAALEVWRHAGDRAEALAFLRRLYPKLAAQHAHLARWRDPDGRGLAAIVHPWESGEDNSPLWDGVLDHLEIPPGALPPYQRSEEHTSELQ